jgi:signal transduction histidine kinase
MAIALLPMLAMGNASAADRGTQPEAIAMVKKAVAFIKANGPEKSYIEFANKAGSFQDRDLYVFVYDLTGKCLEHGANPKLVGKDMTDAQDADGVFYVKDRLALAKTKASFWQDYKYVDPVTKKIAPKTTYCEKLNETLVCTGVYK